MIQREQMRVARQDAFEEWWRENAPMNLGATAKQTIRVWAYGACEVVTDRLYTLFSDHVAAQGGCEGCRYSKKLRHNPLSSTCSVCIRNPANQFDQYTPQDSADKGEG